MNFRPKDPARVREDALRVATRKLAEGCRSCADAYVDLARRNGAGEEQLRQVYAPRVKQTELPPIPGVLGTSSIGLRRRARAERRLDTGGAVNYVSPKKLVVPASVLAAAAPRISIPASTQGITVPASFKPQVRGAPSQHKKRGDPFGVDSNTEPGLGGMPTNFYIGEIGYGTCSDCGPCGGYACFNVHSANLAGAAYTYAYWGLEGPTLTPVGSTPYAWGRAQGNAAADAWANGPYWPYLYTLTLFADIEAGFGGWIGSTQADAQQVLNGFLDGIIANPYSYPLNAGVYINARDINGPNNYFFGPNYTPSQPFVFWPTGTVCGLSICDSATGGCVPCNPVCTPLSTVQNNWNTTVQNACWAGQGAVIWQFWISSCDNSVCAGDFDYTPQSGNTSFSNVACSGSPCLA